MDTEARGILATGDYRLLRFTSGQKLDTIKREMDDLFNEVRTGTLDDTEEWKVFEEAFNSYWASINHPDAPDWNVKRDRMLDAADGLEEQALTEREQNDVKADDLGALRASASLHSPAPRSWSA